MTSPRSRSHGYVDYERVASRYQQGRSLAADVLERWGVAVKAYLPAGPIRLGWLGVVWRRAANPAKAPPGARSSVDRATDF